MNEDTATEFPAFGQQARSEKERALPDYARRELDMARCGYSLLGSPLSEDQRRTVLAKWGLSA